MLISPYRHWGAVILRAAEHSDSVPRAVGASGGAFCEGVHTVPYQVICGVFLFVSCVPCARHRVTVKLKARLTRDGESFSLGITLKCSRSLQAGGAAKAFETVVMCSIVMETCAHPAAAALAASPTT